MSWGTKPRHSTTGVRDTLDEMTLKLSEEKMITNYSQPERGRAPSRLRLLIVQDPTSVPMKNLFHPEEYFPISSTPKLT